ncbi:MAG: RHS repeat-associated core domain-containing protein [Acidobacteria bacterium]|nr:RHS repeat-associated core domain-containing protein [Acidobacteriota bacterium]
MLAEVTGNEVNFLTPDHLGSPRVLTSQNGIVVNRRDFFPFGEDIAVGVGGRSAGMGYGTDSLRQRFTGYERDEETGLDFAQARYYANSMGRFNNPDPLLSSGSVYDPQSWNRYIYTLNNPVRYSDPTGLYVFDESLGGSQTDEELRNAAGSDRTRRREADRIIDRRNAFRRALVDAARAGGSNSLTAQQQELVRTSVAAYGAEGQANGVSVGVGPLANNVAAEARQEALSFPYDEKTKSFSAAVSVIIDDNTTNATDLAIAVAHEGRHVADAQEYAAAITSDLEAQGANAIAGPLNRTKYEREVRGYNVSAFTAQGLGLPNLSFRGNEVWSNGWRAADRERLRSTGINNHLRTSPTYRLTPESPGTRYHSRPTEGR